MTKKELLHVLPDLIGALPETVPGGGEHAAITRYSMAYGQVLQLESLYIQGCLGMPWLSGIGLGRTRGRHWVIHRVVLSRYGGLVMFQLRAGPLLSRNRRSRFMSIVIGVSSSQSFCYRVPV
jgi:hypothetical protein